MSYTSARFGPVSTLSPLLQAAKAIFLLAVVGFVAVLILRGVFDGKSHSSHPTAERAQIHVVANPGAS